MFKKYYIMIENTLRHIPFSVVIAALLVPVYFMYSRGFSMTISNNVWENIYCDLYLMHLWIPIAVLILLSGIGIAKEDDATRYIRMKSRAQLVSVNLISALIAIVLFSFAIISVYILYFRFRQGMFLNNSWSKHILATFSEGEYIYSGNKYPTPIVFNNISPVYAVVLQMLFLIIYCMFLTTVSMAINVIFKQAIGSIVCIFTIMSASLFGKRNFGEYSFYPWYNGNFKYLTENNNIDFIIYAIVYWLLLITIAVVAYYFVMRKADLISISREDRT